MGAFTDGMTPNQFKHELDEGKKSEYIKFFQKKLKKWGVKSVSELDKDKKKKFFDEIEKEWTQDED